MGHMRAVGRQIEAEMQMSFGAVVLVSESWAAPIDMVGLAGDHHLQLSLLPGPADAKASFPEHWGPHRFEPMGDLFLVPANESLHARSECRRQQSIVCRFDPDPMAAWFDRRMEWTDRRLQGSLDIANADVRRLLFRIGEEVRNPGFAGEAMVELMAGQIAIELSRYFLGIDEDKAIGGLAPWRLRLIDDYLTHDSANATLAGLADLCSLSVRHLTRAFRASRGRSIGGYIAEHRVDHAKRLLAEGMSVKQAALALRFTAPSNFATAFRRQTGETPRQYRQRVLSGGEAKAPLH